MRMGFAAARASGFIHANGGATVRHSLSGRCFGGAHWCAGWLPRMTLIPTPLVDAPEPTAARRTPVGSAPAAPGCSRSVGGRPRTNPMRSIRRSRCPPCSCVLSPNVAAVGALQRHGGPLVGQQVRPVLGAVAATLAVRAVGSVIPCRTRNPGAAGWVSSRIERERGHCCNPSGSTRDQSGCHNNRNGIRGSSSLGSKLFPARVHPH
jgi:hypothetical protein